MIEYSSYISNKFNFLKVLCPIFAKKIYMHVYVYVQMKRKDKNNAHKIVDSVAPQEENGGEENNKTKSLYPPDYRNI